ncbi:hypothetical protein PLESTB_000919400 [Pleodorina starrii]|uniref:Endonuclease/exonuclease/phosphatase domain-containing protein n=1 Tax=Pleodorina starrii TaxID=330485 RepID=A0A9W6F3B9_9CHLO|nr:hypothetical protein PLESTB_000919400 [Pleodorina starrii]
MRLKSGPGMARPLANVVGRRMARSRMVRAVVAETGKAAIPQRTINVMTYNILAQKYVQNGWHNYCKSRYLRWEYRKELLFEELEGYDSDIICLQEVEADVFSDELQPFLGMRGYRGHYLARQYGENVQGPPEGVALFYRTDLFELIHHRAFTFASVATDPPAPPAPSLSSSDGEEATQPPPTDPADVSATGAAAEEADHVAATSTTTAAAAAAAAAGGPAPSVTGRPAGKKGGRGPALTSVDLSCEGQAEGPAGATAAAVAEVEPASEHHHCNGSSSCSSSSSASSSGRGGSSSSSSSSCANAGAVAATDGPSSNAGRTGRGRGSTTVAAAAGASTSRDDKPATAPSATSSQPSTSTPRSSSSSPAPAAAAQARAPAGNQSNPTSTSGRASSSGRGASSSGGGGGGTVGGSHRGNSEFWSVFTRRQEGAILALLRHKPSQRPLLAAVTHLFWNPAFPDVKAFQAAVLCREIAAFLRQHAEGAGEAAAGEVPVILAGDFNSLSRKRLPDAFDPKIPRGPDGLVSGVYTLLTRGSLPPDHPDHPATRRRPGETSNADFRGVTLTTSGVNLTSAYRLANGRDPPLTTRTTTFAGCLDYIFVSPAHFDVTSTLELPYAMSPASCDAVRDPLTDVRFPPIPSSEFPSDHLSLVALLRLKEDGDGQARGRDGA